MGRLSIRKIKTAKKSAVRIRESRATRSLDPPRLSDTAERSSSRSIQSPRGPVRDLQGSYSFRFIQATPSGGHDSKPSVSLDCIYTGRFLSTDLYLPILEDVELNAPGITVTWELGLYSCKVSAHTPVHFLLLYFCSFLK